jgi:hypothetical protein
MLSALPVHPFPLPARNSRSKRMALCSGHHPDRGPSHVEQKRYYLLVNLLQFFDGLPLRPSLQAVHIQNPSGCLSLL